MEFTLITKEPELVVKRIIRFHFPLVVLVECKPWKGEMAYKIAGGITSCVMLAKYLAVNPSKGVFYDLLKEEENA